MYKWTLSTLFTQCKNDVPVIKETETLAFRQACINDDVMQKAYKRHEQWRHCIKGTTTLCTTVQYINRSIFCPVPRKQQGDRLTYVRGSRRECGPFQCVFVSSFCILLQVFHPWLWAVTPWNEGNEVLIMKMMRVRHSRSLWSYYTLHDSSSVWFICNRCCFSAQV